MQQYLDDILKIQVYNDGNGILNHKCGADFVKVSKIEKPNIFFQNFS